MPQSINPLEDRSTRQQAHVKDLTRQIARLSEEQKAGHERIKALSTKTQVMTDTMKRIDEEAATLDGRIEAISKAEARLGENKNVVDQAQRIIPRDAF